MDKNRLLYSIMDLLKTGRLEDARVLADKAARYFSSDAAMLSAIGSFFLRHGESAIAARYLNESLALREKEREPAALELTEDDVDFLDEQADGFDDDEYDFMEEETPSSNQVNQSHSESNEPEEPDNKKSLASVEVRRTLTLKIESKTEHTETAPIATGDNEPKILVRSRRRLMTADKSDNVTPPTSFGQAPTGDQSKSEAIAAPENDESKRHSITAQLHHTLPAPPESEGREHTPDDDPDADGSDDSNDDLDVDMFGQDFFIEQEDDFEEDFEEEGFSIEVSPVNESESDLEVDTDSVDLMTITEQEFLASDKDLLLQGNFEDDFSDDFLESIEDDLETTDELQDNDKLSRRQRAKQVALEVIINIDWEPSAECIEAITDIFEEYGWSKTKTSIENAIVNGCSLEHILAARDLRYFWRDNEKFWTTFKGISPFELHARAAYKNLSWPQALFLVKYNDQLMSVEEVERYLDEEFDYWYGHAELRRCFPAFLPYLHARKRMHAFSDMADIGEFGIGNLACHDPLDTLDCLYGIPPVAKKLEEIGVNVSNLATFKPTYETFAIRYPQK